MQFDCVSPKDETEKRFQYFTTQARTVEILVFTQRLNVVHSFFRLSSSQLFRVLTQLSLYHRPSTSFGYRTTSRRILEYHSLFFQSTLQIRTSLALVKRSFWERSRSFSSVNVSTSSGGSCKIPDLRMNGDARLTDGQIQAQGHSKPDLLRTA